MSAVTFIVRTWNAIFSKRLTKSRDQLIVDKAFNLLKSIEIDPDDFTPEEQARIILHQIRVFKQRLKNTERKYRENARTIKDALNIINKR